MSLNIPVEILRTPGTKVSITLDFGAWTKAKRTNLRKRLQHGSLTENNEVSRLILATCGLNGYIAGHRRVALNVDLFDTEEAQRELQVYYTHVRLANPDTDPVCTWRSGRSFLNVENTDRQLLNLYDLSRRYRRAIEPVMQAVVNGTSFVFEVTE